ncbi:hypothetical protein J6590_004303 [Homalodisca vitripennis]|nr:hypothetical protein J6590_004303 [Homalodisca vitripennis]
MEQQYYGSKDLQDCSITSQHFRGLCGTVSLTCHDRDKWDDKKEQIKITKPRRRSGSCRDEMQKRVSLRTIRGRRSGVAARPSDTGALALLTRPAVIKPPLVLDLLAPVDRDAPPSGAVQRRVERVKTERSELKNNSHNL